MPVASTKSIVLLFITILISDDFSIIYHVKRSSHLFLDTCHVLFLRQLFVSAINFISMQSYLSFIHLWGEQNISTLSNGLLFLLALWRAALLAAASLCLAAALCFTSTALTSSFDRCLVRGTLPKEDCLVRDPFFVREGFLVSPSLDSASDWASTHPFCLSSLIFSNKLLTSSTWEQNR